MSHPEAVTGCVRCRSEFHGQVPDPCPRCGGDLLGFFSQTALDNWRDGKRYRTQTSHEEDDAIEGDPITMCALEECNETI